MQIFNREILLFLPILITFISIESVSSQPFDLIKVEGDNIVTNVPVYKDNEGNLYSKRITVKFSNRMAEYDIQDESKTDFFFLGPSNEFLQNTLQSLKSEYGLKSIEKVIPGARWGDNIRNHRRTGEMVEISERSQIFYLYFLEPVPIEKVSGHLQEIPEVEYAEGPGVYHLLNDIEPNDPKNSDNWAFESIELQKAWNLTRLSQSDPITIAVSDFFVQDNNEYHEDFKPASSGGNVVESLSGEPFIANPSASSTKRHGIEVGGVIGATTDNGIHISGAAWNPRIVTAGTGSSYINNIRENTDADIINMSWIISGCNNSSILRQAVEDALIKGIIMVAGAGNTAKDLPNSCGEDPDNPNEPFMAYPAAYDFTNASTHVDSLGKMRVISVAGTYYSQSADREQVYNHIVDGHSWNFVEEHISIFDTNYFNESLSADTAHIDIAAPARRIVTLYGSDVQDTTLAFGTSFAAPYVSSVIGLILSIQSQLTHKEIYDILTKTADDVPFHNDDPPTFYNHPDPNDNRKWNGQSGFGRANAYNALIHTIENYGAVLGKDMNEVTLTLEKDMQLKHDIDLADNTILTIESHDGTTTLTSESGTVTIGGQWSGGSSKITGDDGVDGLVSPELEEMDARPGRFHLSQNYPNPFNPETVFRYELPVESEVVLEVYDILGRRVTLLVNGVKPAGVHQATWDGTNAASGLYIYRIHAGDFIQSRQMLLVK